MDKTNIQDFCNSPLPRDAVQQREAFGGVKLSYVSGHYVTNALNECFGSVGWTFYEGSFDLHDDEKDAKGRYRVSCVYRGALVVGGGKRSEDVGVGHGIAKTKGEAIESAVKEARTDCLKRCAKDLGPRFGLALYEKEQTGVQEMSFADLKEMADTVTTQDQFERWCYLATSALKTLDAKSRKELKAIKDTVKEKVDNG